MEKVIIYILIIFSLLLSGCVTQYITDEQTTEIPGIISREILWGNPDKSGLTISPDGSMISYLAPYEGVMNIWVAPSDKPEEAIPITNDTYRGISYFGWAYTNNHILVRQDTAGEENWRIYSINLTNGKKIDLTPVDGVQARVFAIVPKFPYEIIVGLNDRNPQLHDLYRINIETGERSLIYKNNEGFISFIIDGDYNVRLAGIMNSSACMQYYLYNENNTWDLLLDIPYEDVLTTSPLWFDKSGEILRIKDSRNRNTSALYAYNLKTGNITLIAEDPNVDLCDVMVHPTNWTVEAVAFSYTRKEWKILDDSVRNDINFLSNISDGEIEVTSRSLDDRYWTVIFRIDNGPVQFYLYDREKKDVKFLFTNREELEGLSLSKMHPVIIKSRDGLNLVSYYSLPVWYDYDEDGYPNEPLPMIVHVHGGPWSRNDWGYNRIHQWLTNRGYAVLSVNFRGSTGFGKEFLNAGNLEWGGKMHDDLIDGVNWAIEEGIADPDLIGIMGGSYGGYATLWGMTYTPEVFCCGVDICGPSNLTSDLESIESYGVTLIEQMIKRVGDYRTEEGRAFLAEHSPITYVDQIINPLLIGHGGNDPRVKQNESENIVQEMLDKNIPVTYVLYPDEGHGFSRPENDISFFAIAEAFFSKCLGGRYEPIGDDFENSSITIPVGSEYIPGLDEMIRK